MSLVYFDVPPLSRHALLPESVHITTGGGERSVITSARTVDHCCQGP
jgi:hypothetical protein